ncbi:multiple inositol polyphosphate phosphatase 1 [Anopheles bellator]|uniref:multiple inositol polyphosphate phosphatase 1 n=1 Tax=Anopheles bellator TaxID=139047 RepID=UPI0026474E16|nr:multiple inositol polyphosphate phosphatase 1 [Anopheles bellator]
MVSLPHFLWFCAVSFVCFLCSVSLVADADRWCAANAKDTVFRRLGTKTPYRHVQNKDLRNSATIDDCTLVKIWGLFRHGTRNPSKTIIDHMHGTLVDLQKDIVESGRICRENLAQFEAWKPQVTIEDAKLLVREGGSELLQLGERFRARFGSHLPERYDGNLFYFKYTKTERAEYSARNFSRGLFGRDEPIDFPESLHRDPVLRFYKGCEKWKRQVKENPYSYQELDRFGSSKEMRTVVEKLSKRVGTFVSPEEIRAMYQTCAFETAWNRQEASPWCLLFDKESISVMEFNEDLKYYWIDGYGYELTYRQACSAFRDLLTHFDDGGPPFTFYFTHSGTLLKSLAFLGLYKDSEPLMAQHYRYKRKWRVSQIDAFGSNLYFTLYSCPNGTKSVGLYHQERLTQIPGCPSNQMLCNYDHFWSLYADRIEQCDFDDMCSVPNVPGAAKDEL